MKDISITDYLGPGVYLLYKYAQEAGVLIAEKGYKICYCEDLSSLRDTINENNVDFILISELENKFDEYIDIIKISIRSSVRKIIIDVLIKESQHDLYLKFINLSHQLGYSLDSAFPLFNTSYNDSFQGEQNIKILLDYSKKQMYNPDKKTNIIDISEKRVVSALPYVRPGDSVLIISQSRASANYIRYIFLEQTKVSKVQLFSLDNTEEFLPKNDSFHFIFIDEHTNNDLIDSLDSITKSLLPAGRYALSKPRKELIQALDALNVHPEVYFISEQYNLEAKIHQGEAITILPELCIFMKSPLERTDFSYEETIYGYSHPPENLLAFARDYNNPWLIRGIVEFPFRNSSPYHLNQYSRKVLQCSPPNSPDYAAALAVLGYQFLNNGSGTDLDDTLKKMLAYCSSISTIVNPTPHQYRWYISLSTLQGLIYNKKNNKVNALIHFSHAANSNIKNFSPSIGTKILQSLYLQSIILLSLNKISCAEIIIEKGIKRGIQLLYQKPEELVGKMSHPFNFVLFIYHDIIDWIIKLVNIKNATYFRKFNIANYDNNQTWSALLHERMRAINNMSIMIEERDNAIISRDKVIDFLQREVSSKDQRITELIQKHNEVITLIDKKAGNTSNK